MVGYGEGKLGTIQDWQEQMKVASPIRARESISWTYPGADIGAGQGARRAVA